MSKHAMSQLTPQNIMSKASDRWRIFGDYIKTERENANLSQEGLGDLIDRDRQTIYRIENGLSGTTRETVLALAVALKLDKATTLQKAGFALQDTSNLKPQTVKEFYKILEAMGSPAIFDDEELDLLSPDDLQDLLDSVAANMQVKIKRRKEAIS